MRQPRPGARNSTEIHAWTQIVHRDWLEQTANSFGAELLETDPRRIWTPTMPSDTVKLLFDPRSPVHGCVSAVEAIYQSHTDCPVDVMTGPYGNDQWVVWCGEMIYSAYNSFLQAIGETEYPGVCDNPPWPTLLSCPIELIPDTISGPPFVQ